MDPEHRITPLPRHGAHLITHRDGRRVVRMRTGRFVAVRGDSDLAGVAGAIGGTAPGGDAARLIDELDASDAIDRTTRWPMDRRAICLLGIGGPLDALAAALRAWGVDATRCETASHVPADTALVLAFADGSAAREAWQRLDDLPQRGVAWLRAYREGECVFVDPIAITGADATSVQVNRRRLAASAIPDELAAWQRERLQQAPPMDAATTTLTVARLLHVLLAWAHGADSLASHRVTLWKLVPATATVTEHVVLAYPDTPPRMPR